MKRIILIVTLILTLFNLSFARELIVAGIPEEPNRWITEDGEIKGLDVDIIDYILNKIGVEYTIILENSSSRLEALWKMEQPRYDVVFTYSKKPERAKYLNYADEAHIAFSWNFFYKKENEGKYKFESYDDLEGLRIGVTRGISYTDEFWEVANSGKVFKKDEVVQNDIQMRKLLAGRIDLVPLNTQATLYEAKKGGFSDKIGYLEKPLKAKKYYNTFVKASDYPNIDGIRKQYDEILREMKKDGTLNEILGKYGLSFED